MIFSSMLFVWLFLPITLLGNYLLDKLGGNKLTNLFLLFVSIIFYAWGEPVYIFLMLFSIVMNWTLGIFMDRFTSHKKGILMSSVVLNLVLLGYFKYAGMIVDTINGLLGTDIVLQKIALPIGISFFTFQALSYVIDVYRGECQAQKNPMKLALYISFPPAHSRSYCQI